MKKSRLLLFLLYVGFAQRVCSQIERVIVETYYIADAFDASDTTVGKLDTGAVTYRVYVDLKNGNKLLNLYGDANHPLKFSSTKSFFNNIDGQTYARDIPYVLYNSNTVALDTWLTLGQTVKVYAGKTNFGILKTQDNNGSFIGGPNNDLGLLTNTTAALGIPLTVSDGMDTLASLPGNWTSYGIIDIITGIDSSIFGSVKSGREFNNKNVFLKNTGVMGVNPDSNQILIAQLTTKGDLAFELNIEVEVEEDGIKKIIKYVANDSILLNGEKKSSYLTYPFVPANCGCKDPAYIEFDENAECADNLAYCINRVVYGCRDSMACNFDPKANFSIPQLCCYPGSCAGRDISEVCPEVKENSFDFYVYPVPASTALYLNVWSGVNSEIAYSIFNYYGVEVVSESLGLNTKITNHVIDISNLSTGIYLIKVSAGAEYLSQQIIKD